MKKLLIFPIMFALSVIFISCINNGPDIPDHSLTLEQQKEMIFIEGGWFTMGDVWGDGDSIETPVHEVYVNDFYLCKYEFTCGLYTELTDMHMSLFESDRDPANRISWINAINLCNKLSILDSLDTVYTRAYTSEGTSILWDKTKNGYRLPTEAEWEYAARSRGHNDQKWSGTSNPDSVRFYVKFNYEDDRFGSSPRTVNSGLANLLGLKNMCGNAREWCWESKYTYHADSLIIDSDLDSCVINRYHVTRGGYSDLDSTRCRTSTRSFRYYSLSPFVLMEKYGFRLARNVE